MNKLLRAGAASSLLFAIACGGGGGTDAPPFDGTSPSNGNGGVTIGPDGVPVGPDGKPIPPRLDGRYEIATALDLANAGLFPTKVDEAIDDLAALKQHPMQSMADLLTLAKVPVLSDVLNIVPSILRTELLKLIDAHVMRSVFQTVPFAAHVAALAGDIAGVAKRFEVVSTLDLPPGDANGDALAHHTLTGVAFHWADQRIVIGAAEAQVAAATQEVKANAMLLDKRSAEIESGRLELGDHTLSLPIGAFVVGAVDKLAESRTGGKTLRDALGRIVDCHGVGQGVANECIGFVCVGHAGDIERLCNAGLDIVATTLMTKLKGLEVQPVHLKSGTAKMWDAATPGGPLDAVVDRLDEGYWSIGFGKDDSAVLATFTGRRVP